MTPTLSVAALAPSAMMLPGGQMHPVRSAGVAATPDGRYVTPPSVDFETISPDGSWLYVRYARPPPGVAVHCRSSIGAPPSGLAVHVLPRSCDTATVELPSQRSDM